MSDHEHEKQALGEIVNKVKELMKDKKAVSLTVKGTTEGVLETTISIEDTVEALEARLEGGVLVACCKQTLTQQTAMA